MAQFKNAGYHRLVRTVSTRTSACNSARWTRIIGARLFLRRQAISPFLQRGWFISSLGTTSSTGLTAPLVFVGYGLKIPEYNVDDLPPRSSRQDSGLLTGVASRCSGVDFCALSVVSPALESASGRGRHRRPFHPDPHGTRYTLVAILSSPGTIRPWNQRARIQVSSGAATLRHIQSSICGTIVCRFRPYLQRACCSRE